MDVRHQILSLTALSSLNADALLLVVAGDSLDTKLDPKLAAPIDDAIAQGDFVLKAGRTLYLHRQPGVRAGRVVLAAASGTSPKAFKSAVASGLAALKHTGAKHVGVAAAGIELDASHAEALVAAALDATYVYRHTKPSAPPAAALATVTLVTDKVHAKMAQLGITRGLAIGAGVTLAREWANRPANHCTPTLLAEQAKKLAKSHQEVKVEVLDRKAIEKVGMGSFLAVSQGSEEAPRFIVLRYQGAAKTKAPIVLVGKGVTFDTGGISIKPAAEMDEMKFDMGGAASVLGTFLAVAELKPKVNLVGLIPACENMPDGRALKPGDVVTSLSGQTIEVLNTDAEGRLLLCDALTYAERFKPAAVVDIATLTGACVIALGNHRSGLFTADETLASELQDAGQAGLDPCWRMPLDEEYDEGLKSNFADMANVGPRAGGAITAAMFLRRFTAKYRWAHLDIAGTAWKSGAAKGGTGRPVPLLTHFVLSQAS
jgi:leucyl aminopeptidase